MATTPYESFVLFVVSMALLLTAPATILGTTVGRIYHIRKESYLSHHRDNLGVIYFMNAAGIALSIMFFVIICSNFGVSNSSAYLGRVYHGYRLWGILGWITIGLYAINLPLTVLTSYLLRQQAATPLWASALRKS